MDLLPAGNIARSVPNIVVPKRSLNHLALKGRGELADGDRHAGSGMLLDEPGYIGERLQRAGVLVLK
jgi:hypothetical protein